MTLMRSPFRDFMSLREAVDRLFEDAFVRSAADGGTGAGTLPVDVYETNEEFVVQAGLPGLRPEDLNVTWEDHFLNISGEVRPVEQEGASYHLRERRFGRFQRLISFPAPVQAEKVEAQLESGILTVRVPKAEEARPKQIKVRVGSR